MSGRLRHIALTVEQAGLNSYTWVLIESAAGRVFVLKKAESPQTTYMGALTAGYEALSLLSESGLHEHAPESGAGQPKAQPNESIELDNAL